MFVSLKVIMICIAGLLSDLILSRVAAKLGVEWRQVGYELGFEHPTIEQIEMDNPGNSFKQIHTMLLRLGFYLMPKLYKNVLVPFFNGRLLTLYHTIRTFNPLPKDKILDMTNLKAFVGDKFNVAEMKISFFDGEENTAGNEKENAAYQHFLLFPHCFPKPSSLGSLKVGIVW